MGNGILPILAQLQQRLPDDLPFLEQMVNMESPSTDKPLVDAFGRLVGARFEAIGGQVDFARVERFGDHLRVRFSAGSGRPVLLLGHIDTVFSAGEAAKRPFRIDNGRATGPGVFDMKAGILLMYEALRVLRDDGRLKRPVTVLLTTDEEIGSTSSRALIEAEARAACAVFVLEPSLPGGVLKTARKGVGHFTIKAIGRAAHAGVDPTRGINAIEEAAHQVIALRRMSQNDRGTTVTVGVIQGGTRSNVVPAEAALDVDVRVPTMEEAERVTQTIRALQPQLPGARLEVRGGVNRPPMERTADIVRLFELAREIAAEMNIDLREGSTGGGSDGNLTAALGVPTLDGLGAVGDHAHGVDEFVEVASLPQRAALLAGLIERV